MSSWGRCAEKGCPCPALVGARWCRRHWQQFKGDWPTRHGAGERNVTARARERKPPDSRPGLGFGSDTARGVGAAHA